MSDILEMPTNDENYYRKARNYLEKQDYKQAIPLLKESFHLSPDATVLADLVDAYIMTEQYEELKQFWASYNPSFDEIWQNPILSQQYILVLNHTLSGDARLLALYDAKDAMQKRNLDTRSIDSQIQHLKKQQIFLSKLAAIPNEDSMQDLITSLMRVEYLPTEQQSLLNFIEVSFQLSFNEVELFYRCIVERSDIPNYFKTQILHHLLKDQVATQFEEYCWFDETHKVATASLKAYQDTDTYQAVKADILEYTASQDPHLAEDLLLQWELQAQILYPFLELAIPNPKTWLKDIFRLFNQDNTQETAPYLTRALIEMSQLTRY